MTDNLSIREQEPSAKALLEELADWGTQPFEQARALPPAVYLSQDVLGLEEQHIFKTDWICVGRAESIPQPGDYMTCDLLDQPVMVIRGEDHQIRAMSNVCLHRMSRLLEGTGCAKRITCPYHAWTYELDGRLRHAPHMEKSPAFCKQNYRLPAIQCEQWEGWIYVTLTPSPVPVATQLQPLFDTVVGRYRMANYVETFREEHVWQTNWKVLAENFMESYHLFKLHRATVGPHSRVDEMQCPPGGEAFNYHWITKESSLAIGNAHPDNQHLKGEWRRTTALITIYPSHLVTLTPGYFWYLVLQPCGIDQVRIVYGGGMAPEYVNDERHGEYLEELKTLLDQVNAEDKIGVKNVFRGMKSSLAKGGHLCHLERPNYEFGQFLTRRICGSGGS
ncbi:MAG: aromatic ring-hydroxylating oxygenase subunit alpha [Pseudomonadales bacterium]